MKRWNAERWSRAARRWLTAPPRQRLAAGQVLVLWAGAEAALRLVSLPTACRAFGVRLTPAGTSDAGSISVGGGATGELPDEVRARVEQDRASVDRVLRVVHPEGGCLRRALVLGRLLRDLDPVLRIGVARSAESFEAHAWLEVQGTAIAEGHDSIQSTFVPLRPPSPRQAR